MKSIFIFTVLFMIQITAQDFQRNLPDTAMLSQITSQKFPSSNAVIIVKEQSLKIETGEITYMGLDYKGISIQNTFVKIVKILNEEGVAKYGSFEYSYREYFGNEVPCGFKLNARVLKPSGDIEVVSENDIHKIVSYTNRHNEPLERKVIMKVSNLEVGDVLQIEYTLNEPFNTSTSGIFYYQDTDIVLFSNVYITLPAKYEIDVFSFPEDKVGQPKIEQYSQAFGAGKTYFWSVKNCNSIPTESFSMPFQDVSYLTGFIVKVVDHKDYSDWNNIVKHYFEDYIDKQSVGSSFFEDLGLSDEVKSVSMSLVDSLYTKIKMNYRVRKENEIYPYYDIDDVIEEKKGDATDLSFLMYKALEEWEQPAHVVLIRDKRQGSFEESLPTLLWFDRIGVMVKIGDEEKLFDFEESVQNNFETPWYLNGISLLVVNEESGDFQKMKIKSGTDENQVFESHKYSLINTPEIKDKMQLTYLGCFAENVRDKYYSVESNNISKEFRSDFISCFSEIDTVVNNDFYNNSNAVVSFTGSAPTNAEQIDSFLVVKLQESIFSKLKTKLFSSARKNHILFDTPFKYTVEFNIPVPKGFKIKNLPPAESFNSTFGAMFNMISEDKGSEVRVTGVIQFSKNLIDVVQYPKIIQFLENSIKGINKEIIFSKI